MGDHKKSSSSQYNNYGHGRFHKRRALSGADEDGVSRYCGRQSSCHHTGSASQSKQKRRLSLGDEGRKAGGGGSQGTRNGSTPGSSISGSYSSNNVSCSHRKEERSVATAPRLYPLTYKTELCRSYEENGECRFASACTFAHGLAELRAVPRHPRYKTEMCRTYHRSGYCQYGIRCHFVHDPSEAAGVSFMRGHRFHYKQDKSEMYLLALAEKMGIISDPVNNEVLTTNLKHLYNLWSMPENQKILNATPVLENGIQGDVNYRECSKKDLWELPQNISSMSLGAANGTEVENGKLLNISNGTVSDPSTDGSADTATDGSADTATDGSADTGIFSCSSSIVAGDDFWWAAWNSLVPQPLSPNKDAAKTYPATSQAPLETEISVAAPANARIETAMQISHNLQLPNILEFYNI